MRAFGPELDPRTHAEKLGMVGCACKPNPGNEKRGRSQGFTGWTAQTPWQALDQWETNLKRET